MAERNTGKKPRRRVGADPAALEPPDAIRKILQKSPVGQGAREVLKNKKHVGWRTEGRAGIKPVLPVQHWLAQLQAAYLAELAKSERMWNLPSTRAKASAARKAAREASRNAVRELAKKYAGRGRRALASFIAPKLGFSEEYVRELLREIDAEKSGTD